MKKLIALLMTLIITTTVVAQPAQGRRGPGRRMNVEDQLNHLKTVLELSENQVEQLKPILEERQKEHQEAFENRTGDRDAMRAQMDDIRKKYEEKITNILTDEQKVKYEKMVKDAPQRRRGDRGRGRN